LTWLTNPLSKFKKLYPQAVSISKSASQVSASSAMIKVPLIYNFTYTLIVESDETRKYHNQQRALELRKRIEGSAQ
jgi:hypothetical protein